MKAGESHHLQAQNKRWWETHPMSYDWHKTLTALERTPEFFHQIDSRFFSSSPFYKGNRPFERLIPFERLLGKRVLEIGCGLGAHAQLLCEAGCKLTCIDITETAVEHTECRLALRGLDAEIRRMDAEEMTFPDAEFDFVWSWGVIHHSANPERILKQVYRVLKPAGEFRLMVYHRRSLSGLYCLGRGLLNGKFFQAMSTQEVLSFYTDGYLANFYTRSELIHMLAGCGFSEVETQVLGQKSELLPLPGRGTSGRLKAALLKRVPDHFAERILLLVGYFLFAMARKDPHEATRS